jgi:hypothetical protein
MGQRAGVNSLILNRALTARSYLFKIKGMTLPIEIVAMVVAFTRLMDKQD